MQTRNASFLLQQTAHDSWPSSAGPSSSLFKTSGPASRCMISSMAFTHRQGVHALPTPSRKGRNLPQDTTA